MASIFTHMIEKYLINPDTKWEEKGNNKSAAAKSLQ